MEAIKKQASKLREQVAKQQQAILRQLGQLGHETVIVDEAEAQYHEQLQNLYKSTRAAKYFQKDIVRGVEGLISTNKKQMEIARRVAEDCCKYGIENQSDTSPLAREASEFGTSHVSIEDQRDTMLGILRYQVAEPIRASITGAPLEDARHLTHQYGRVLQEFESQAAEVIRRKSKWKGPSAEDVIKLKSAETKLSELKSSMLTLGREATTAMLSVQEQQQQITFQKLLTMVNAERSYHQNVVAVLEKLYSEMMMEEELKESSLQLAIPQRDKHVAFAYEDTTLNVSDAEVDVDKNQHRDKHVLSVYGDTTLNRPYVQEDNDRNQPYFIAKVTHSFDAQEDGELCLAVGDYVVVRQVARNGWSEGECNGEAGWFPSAYVEMTHKTPVGILSEENPGK